MMDAQRIAEVLQHARRDDIRAFPSLELLRPAELVYDRFDPAQLARAQLQQRLAQARYALFDVCRHSTPR